MHPAANVALIPNFFTKFWKILSMYRWFVYSMFLNSGEHAASFLVPGGFSSLFIWLWSFCPSSLAAWRTFSCRLTWEFSTSDFELPRSQFPGTWSTLFLSSSFPGLTWDPKLDEEVASLYCLCISRFTGLAVAVGEPSFEVVSYDLFDMASITMRSLILEKHFKWLQEYIEKLTILNTHRRWFHYFSRNFFWSECQRVGFWCQHIWFWCRIPNWLCQITNQEQLCGFWTHVSSSDFVL